MYKVVFLTLCLVAGSLSYRSTGPFPETNPYVVNGTDASILDYPYICSLRVGNSHNCGASILNERWILTAAHCSGTTVQCGAQTISASGENIHQVGQFIRHEGYSSATLINDIAVLELTTPLVFGPTIQPTKLAPSFYEVPGNWESAAVLAGYGYQMTGGSIQTRLQEVEILVASNAHCNSVHRNQVFPSNICAGIPEGGKGQCSGDSGGPLREVSTGYQVGIVSWSEKPCTIAPYPGVYTKNSHHCAWIESKTGVACPTLN